MSHYVAKQVLECSASGFGDPEEHELVTLDDNWCCASGLLVNVIRTIHLNDMRGWMFLMNECSVFVAVVVVRFGTASKGGDDDLTHCVSSWK